MKSSGYTIEYKCEKIEEYVKLDNFPDLIYYELFDRNDEQVEEWYNKKKDIIYYGKLVRFSATDKFALGIVTMDGMEIIVKFSDEFNYIHNRIRKYNFDKHFRSKLQVKHIMIELEELETDVIIKPYFINK